MRKEDLDLVTACTFQCLSGARNCVKVTRLLFLCKIQRKILQGKEFCSCGLPSGVLSPYRPGLQEVSMVQVPTPRRNTEIFWFYREGRIRQIPPHLPLHQIQEEPDIRAPESSKGIQVHRWEQKKNPSLGKPLSQLRAEPGPHLRAVESRPIL